MAIQKPSHTLAKIHLKALHTNRTHILFALSFTVFINTFCFAQDTPNKSVNIPADKKEAPVEVSIDSLLKTKETNSAILDEKSQDSTLNDSIKPKKEGLLEAIVSSKAKDYMLFNKKEQKMYLYNQPQVLYQDMELTAGSIIIDYSKNQVYAGRIKDSVGEYT